MSNAPTLDECPALGCDAGMVLTREGWEAGGGHFRVAFARCAYCGGTGAVTPAQAIAYTGKRKQRAGSQP